METHNILGVEIFSAGTWNGDSYTVEDLEGMVTAFDKHKETVRPFLKLGHDEKQKMLQKDGYPAAGWIDRLYMKGEKLVADFSSIPKTIYELIKNKAYRNVSSEIYCNTSIGDQSYKYMLGAVALLGADTPAVMNLADIMAMYSKIDSKNIKYYTLSAPFGSEKEENMKTEAEIKLELDLKAKADELEQTKLEFTKNQEAIKANEAELMKLKAEKAETDRILADLKLAATKAEVAKFTSELVGQKLISLAMKPHVEALLEQDKKEYSLNDKKLSKQELLVDMLKLFKAACEVNFVESSSSGQDEKKNTDKELHEKILKYAAEHKVSYGQATKAVVSQKRKGE